MYSTAQQENGPDLSKPVTVTGLQKMADAGEKIACLTAYDASFAAQLDMAGVDAVLVGDSMGMVVQGHSTTVPVTVDHIIYHSQAVARGLQRGYLIADMPFLSYSDTNLAMTNAARLMQEGNAKMVKLEGGVLQAELVAYLTARGVPVCGHIGLQPQSIHKLGGYKVQGKDEAAAERMLDDVRALNEAGIDLLLVECVPNEMGQRIQELSNVPVIGIGAGPDVDGQIMVLHDMLNITAGRKPRFVRNFMSDGRDIQAALQAYVQAVKTVEYPAPEHCFLGQG